MKYILLNDLFSIISRWKYFICWISVIIMYPIFLKIGVDLDFNTTNIIYNFYGNIGSLSKINSIIEYGMLVFNLGFFSYLSIFLFTSNLELGKENIFLRISHKKWIICKIFSIILMIMVFVIIENILLLMVYKILGATISLNNFIIILFYNMISRLLFSFICILIMLFSKKYFFVIAILIYLIGTLEIDNCIITSISQTLYSSEYHNIVPMMITITIIIITYFTSERKIYELFGR